jgi:hypothetical protein
MADVIYSGGATDEQIVVGTSNGAERGIKTLAVSGDILYSGGATDTQVVVQTAGGAERAQKVFNLNSGGGGGGGYVLPTATANRLGGIKVGENLTVEADGTLNAQAGGGGTTAVTKWFNNVTGTTLNTVITDASVSVYKDGQLLQPGIARMAKLYKGGSGKSLVLAQTAPLSTASSWSIKTRVRWFSDGTSSTPVVYSYSGTTDRQAPCLATASQSHLGMFMSSNGSSWDIDDAFYSSLVPQDGVTYDFDTSFTGTKYQFKYSTDFGKNWTIERDIANSLAIYCVSPFRFLNNNLSSSYYNASIIEWAVTQIIIDGQVWFDGATAVEGTDYTNEGCTLTEVPSSTNDYHYDSITGVITFSATLSNENIAVEYGKSTGGGGGSSDYADLTNKPKINNVTLSGNKTGADLGLLSNTATGTGSLTVLGTASTSATSTNIGVGSKAKAQGTTSLGNACYAQGRYSTAIGYACAANYESSLAIGGGTSTSNGQANALAVGAIQIGGGQNTTANTVQIKDYQILDANGHIPADRMTHVVELTTTSVELASDTIYNGAELASVTFTLPANVPANFTAQLNFTSGTTATTFTAPATLTFEGDACSNGVFTPLASKRYSVLIYTDGVNVIGLVMGN